MIGKAEPRICVFCLKPIGPKGVVAWLGFYVPNTFAHKACWDERYHPVAGGKAEVREQQASLFSEDPAK